MQGGTPTDGEPSGKTTVVQRYLDAEAELAGPPVKAGSCVANSRTSLIEDGEGERHRTLGDDSVAVRSVGLFADRSDEQRQIGGPQVAEEGRLDLASATRAWNEPPPVWTWRRTE